MSSIAEVGRVAAAEEMHRAGFTRLLRLNLRETGNPDTLNIAVKEVIREHHQN